ncbi:MAG: hybrid sensor histidine kinase/response regulator, partial [Betaproteobacteria bacterium]|nr:hybrid sensor histidine kinase/response regulator [Betaproteobacteria bacterium]
MAILAGELGRNAGLPPETQEDLALLRQQVEHCKGIITGLAARAGQARAEGGGAVALDHWLEQVIARWRQLRPHAAAKVSLHGTATPPRIVGEATLEQALLNLFNNAADADGGEVDIDADWDDECLRIEIGDRGPGFGEKVLLQAGRDSVHRRPEGGGRRHRPVPSHMPRWAPGRPHLASRPPKIASAITRHIRLPLERDRRQAIHGNDMPQQLQEPQKQVLAVRHRRRPAINQKCPLRAGKRWLRRRHAALQRREAAARDSLSTQAARAVLDLNIAGTSGLTLIAPLLTANPACRIVVLTRLCHAITTAFGAIKLTAPLTTSTSRQTW